MAQSGKRYRIGEIAKESGVTVRTVRYYDELGLLKSSEKTGGGQRVFSATDAVYIKRILELKALGFSLEEIRGIIKLGSSDKTGELRRNALLKSYREKLGETEGRIKKLKALSDELRWHVLQLEGAGEGFQECPGRLCESCSFRKRCSFALNRSDS